MITSQENRFQLFAQQQNPSETSPQTETQRGVESLHGAVNDNPTANNFNSIPRWISFGLKRVLILSEVPRKILRPFPARNPSPFLLESFETSA